MLSTGVVVTAAGPHSGDDDVTRRFGDLLLATRVHVRAAVVFAVLAAILVAWVWREGGADRLTRRLTIAAVPLIALQIGLGEYQYRNGLPWEVVVFHVTTAALVWAVIVAACWSVARPVASRLRAAGGEPLAGDAAHGVRQRPQPPLRDIGAAVDADAVGPGLDRVEGRAQALLALAPAQLLAQLALAEVGVGRRLRGVVVAVAPLLGVPGEVALLERRHHLLTQALQARGGVVVACRICGHRAMVAAAPPPSSRPAEPEACADGAAIACSAGGSGGEVWQRPTRSRRPGSSGGSRAASARFDGVDLIVERGEVYGFLGPNGAGKSTMVRMLATLLRPTGGRALVAGRDVVTEAAAVRRSIGVALQDAAIDPYMTGRELLHLQAVLHGFPRAVGRARAVELLERVDLTDAADRRVATYSGGMRRRLDLALALVHEPEVLFLDEPTTGLDPISRLTLWDEVRRLNGDGTTVFLTTQYLEEADQLAGRVGIIDGGRIVAEGTPAELKAQVGEPTLNVALADPEDEGAATAALRVVGDPLPARPGAIALRLPGGAAALPAAVRALDEAGVAVAGLDLALPTLDDVFVAKTGRRLEAEGADQPAEAAPSPA